jgi:hypothetical protein
MIRHVRVILFACCLQLGAAHSTPAQDVCVGDEDRVLAADNLTRFGRFIGDIGDNELKRIIQDNQTAVVILQKRRVGSADRFFILINRRSSTRFDRRPLSKEVFDRLVNVVNTM